MSEPSDNKKFELGNHVPYKDINFSYLNFNTISVDIFKPDLLPNDRTEMVIQLMLDEVLYCPDEQEMYNVLSEIFIYPSYSELVALPTKKTITIDRALELILAGCFKWRGVDIGLMFSNDKEKRVIGRHRLDRHWAKWIVEDEGRDGFEMDLTKELFDFEPQRGKKLHYKDGNRFNLSADNVFIGASGGRKKRCFSCKRIVDDSNSVVVNPGVKRELRACMKCRLRER